MSNLKNGHYEVKTVRTCGGKKICKWKKVPAAEAMKRSPKNRRYILDK